MSETFELSTIRDYWKGCRITSLHDPIVLGIERLKDICLGKAFLGFVLVHSFDYDGLLMSIDGVDGFETEEAAGAALDRAIEVKAAQLLATNEGWEQVSDAPLPPQIMPATGSTMPGRFARQIAGRKFMRGNPYDSIYFRAMLLERSSDLAEEFLRLDGHGHEVINYVERLGAR